MINHRLDIYDTAGVLQYRTDDFLKLGCVKRVNYPGLVTVELSGESAIPSNIADKWQIEVWRQPEGQTWAKEITGIYRKGDWEQPVISRAVLTAKGLLSMLGWRIVAYPAGTTDRSKFINTAAETIANTLVKYNATASGTLLDGRKRVATIAGLSVEADGADGNLEDWYCAWDNLLVTLQELALIGGGDFDLVKLTPTTWEYRWYLGQLGTDRSASVFFSMGIGNMAIPKYGIDGMNAASVAIVGGKGEGINRMVEVVNGGDYNVTSTSSFLLMRPM